MVEMDDDCDDATSFVFSWLYFTIEQSHSQRGIARSQNACFTSGLYPNNMN
jgi:hypothetical protein